MMYRFLHLPFVLVFFASIAHAQPIDRKSVVDRHRVVLTVPDTLGSLSVGNGRFAYTCDITGLQTFPEAYTKGVPLGTQSDWGWHRFPDTAGLPRERSIVQYPLDGRQVGYLVPTEVSGCGETCGRFLSY